jgi:phage shock protein PspC (stress-responsive transcriptional regulator)
MTCLRCQREIAADARFCPACGAPQPAENGPAWAERRLVRIPSQKKIAGVCAGIADYLDVDVSLMRVLWLALSIVPGAIVGGVVAYLLAWVVMPEGQPTRMPTGRRLIRSTTDAKIAGVCGGLADYFGVDSTPVRVLWIVLSVMPGAIVGGVLAYLAAWLILPKPPLAVMSPTETRAI